MLVREPLQDLRFGEQVETAGRFAEEDYTADGEEVKGGFEVGLEPSPSLRQTADFAQLARP